MPSDSAHTLSDRGEPEEGWIGVDLDGTLAHYDEWRGPTHIGEPIPKMVERVKAWLKEGKKVKIFTARITAPRDDFDAQLLALQTVAEWCEKHLGQRLPVTAEKDLNMIELWDDRAVQVEKNTGRRVDDLHCRECNLVMFGPEGEMKEDYCL